MDGGGGGVTVLLALPPLKLWPSLVMPAGPKPEQITSLGSAPLGRSVCSNHHDDKWCNLIFGDCDNLFIFWSSVMHRCVEGQRLAGYL